MKNKPILMSAVVAGLFVITSGAAAFAQTPVQSVAQNRIAQPIVINGARADAAYVLAPGGGIQSYSCPSPQQYATADGGSQGWACFDSATNVWLLSALPPQQQAPAPVVVQQQVVQQPVYQQPVYTVAPPVIVYGSPVYYGSPYYYRQPYYSPSIGFGIASINAGGRIAAAVIESSRFHDNFRGVRVIGNRGGRR